MLAYRHERGREDRASATLPLGRPFGQSKVHVLDARMRPVPVGVAGELHLGGGGLARGYLGCPDQTAESFVPDPLSPTPGGRLYATGDIGRYLVSGDVEFLGRDDDQVKVRGFRIELGEIEAVLTSSPGVREAVVSAREDSTGGRRLVAYVVAEKGEHDPLPGLRERLREHLPEAAVPSDFVALDKLPLARTGKVDRRALPDPDELARRPEVEPEGPRNEPEERLFRIWAELLGRERFGVHDSFFDLGGHSSAPPVLPPTRPGSPPPRTSPSPGIRGDIEPRPAVANAVSFAFRTNPELPDDATKATIRAFPCS